MYNASHATCFLLALGPFRSPPGVGLVSSDGLTPQGSDSGVSA